MFACGQLGLRYADARNMTLWELNVKAEGYRRKDRELLNKFRVHASILISPHAKKGAHITPSRVWPVEGDSFDKPSTKESFEEALRFFARKEIKKEVVN